jgi:hypothetical protein
MPVRHASFGSDPEAVEALLNPVGGEGGPAAVEIRCADLEGPAQCGSLLGTLVETHRGRVLTIRHWPIGEVRSARNRQDVVLFLDQAGDVGMYSCRVHGSWPADINEIRHSADDGVARGIPRMNLRVRPTPSAEAGCSNRG